MSDNIALQAEGLGKRYVLGKRAPGTILCATAWLEARAKFTSGIAQPRLNSISGRLREASFTIEHGENVGIIGLNGAGKSTLLKILSRITDPTSGSADIDGRVGALLEVGPGFHPELTGGRTSTYTEPS